MLKANYGKSKIKLSKGVSKESYEKRKEDMRYFITEQEARAAAISNMNNHLITFHKGKSPEEDKKVSGEFKENYNEQQELDKEIGFKRAKLDLMKSQESNFYIDDWMDR